MGTMIHLALGRLNIDWGKNGSFTDHGPLFQPADLKLVPSYYAGEDWPEGQPIVEMNDGFGKPLQYVLARLELLGYTLHAVEQHYDLSNQLRNLNGATLPFDKLRQVLARVDVGQITGNYGEGYELGKFVGVEVLEQLGFQFEDHSYYSDRLQPDHWEVDLLLECFDANGALRLLAENPANHKLDVSWDFTPLVESGWAERDEFEAGPLPHQRFLVVTEGSSDSKIIKRALELYRPHIADFFDFVDMEEGYPFSGTGNLYKFTQGLISIGVLNNVVVVYDNDAEGVAKLQATKKLSLPSNMRVMKLPRHDDLANFKTIGPTGIGCADINGRAAAIECYLDLDKGGLPEPVVRWGAFNHDLGVYHGELQHKTQYMKRFLNLKTHSGDYKSAKIESVLDALVAECVSIAEGKIILH